MMTTPLKGCRRRKRERKNIEKVQLFQSAQTQQRPKPPGLHLTLKCFKIFRWRTEKKGSMLWLDSESDWSETSGMTYACRLNKVNWFIAVTKWIWNGVSASVWDHCCAHAAFQHSEENRSNDGCQMRRTRHFQHNANWPDVFVCWCFIVIQRAASYWKGFRLTNLPLADLLQWNKKNTPVYSTFTIHLHSRTTLLLFFSSTH